MRALRIVLVDITPVSNWAGSFWEVTEANSEPVPGRHVGQFRTYLVAWIIAQLVKLGVA